jgi:hypothetical protein
LARHPSLLSQNERLRHELTLFVELPVHEYAIPEMQAIRLGEYLKFLIPSERQTNPLAGA